MNRIRNAIRRVAFQFAILLVSTMVATIPALAEHSSSSRKIQQDAAGKECSRAGMPCSTALTPDSSKSKSASTQQKLDQIERQSVNSIKSTQARVNPKTAPQRPVVARGAERQSSINFSYHAPSAGGTSTGPR
jgi:propanediol dehydratase small subunit